MKKKIRVLIVDDHAVMLFALSEAIDRQPDLTLVGEADNSAQAIVLYRKLKPDVVTMDYNLPGTNGIECTAAIRREFPDAKVLLLSIYQGSEDIWRATQAGATGYVSKSVDIKEILRAIRSVAEGKPCFSAGLAEKLATRQTAPSLSPKELEVLQKMVAGCNNKEIEADLNLSKSSVKHYIASIFSRLQVMDRSQAIAAAVKRGIIHLDQ
jgi:DNA-binding NarL/FixJ family response regulator